MDLLATETRRMFHLEQGTHSVAIDDAISSIAPAALAHPSSAKGAERDVLASLDGFVLEKREDAELPSGPRRH